MSDTPDDTTKTETPLPRPVGEDGLIQDDEDREQGEDVDAADGGLADVGSGKPDQRKIV